MKYRYLDDITSDVMFEAYGKSFEELLVNAAEALNKVICQMEKISEEKKIEVEIIGKDEKELVWNFLQEIIAQVDIEAMFFKRFEIISIKKEKEEIKIKAIFYGEDMKKEKGETVVKALTNYNFKFENKEDNKEGKFMTRISVDI